MCAHENMKLFVVNRCKESEKNELCRTLILKSVEAVIAMVQKHCECDRHLELQWSTLVTPMAMGESTLFIGRFHHNTMIINFHSSKSPAKSQRNTILYAQELD